MMKRYTLYIWMLTVGILITTSCTDNDFFSAEEEIVNVTYNIGFSDNAQGRALDDEAGVNQLSVGVYEGSKLVGIYDFELKEGETSFKDVKIPLLKERTYTLLFWAQIKGMGSSNTFYTLDFNTGTLTVDYNLYDDISLAEAESFKAFYKKESNVTIVKTENEGKPITLSRPFSQLNIAVKGEELSKVQRTSFTINQVYSQMNLLKEEMIGDLSEEEFSFCLSDAEKGNPQTIEIEGSSYNYVASAYLLAPEKVNLNGSIDGGEGTIPKELSFTNLSLQANYRTNIYGDLVIQEEMKGWDGSLEFPEDYQLTQDEQYRYIIDEEMDLAWLSLNASSLSENATFIVTKDVLDMGGHTISSIQLPDGSTFDGDGKTIKNYANSLFGDATNLTVRNLVLDNVHASSEGHVGVLVNTLTGSSTFTGVSVSNSSATTTDGAAGGIVGYIVRNRVDDRTETLTVTFSNCDLVGVTAKGLLSEGKFVGLLSGYDNGETLAFDAECSVDAYTSVNDYTSPYQVANQSVWLIDTGNTDNNLTDTYDGWLGTETYRRGNVTFEGKCLVPKWDGTTTVEPLLYNNTNNQFEVYSPFDLAGVRAKTASPAAIYFKSNIDMNGMGKDGLRATPLPMRDESEINDDNLFSAFNSVKTLDGGGFTLYNLSIEETHDGYSGAAFIKGASGDTEHKNLTIQNADIKNYHDPNFPSGTEGNAYAGTLVSTIEGNYKSSNITIVGGNVFAICKMGGLYGRIASGTATITGCTVDGTIISNYDSGFNDTFLDTEILNVPVVIDFHSDGEVGGLIGFITGNATIIDCTVRNCHFYCTGENDWDLNVFIAAAKVPGRHVNQFIGDIRTDSGETITITNYSMSNNNMHSTETSLHGEKFRASDKYKEFKSRSAKTWDCVGFVYAVTIKFNDVPGTVKINNSTVMVSESMRK